MLSDEVYKNLTDEESVHLADWPKVQTLQANDELVATMDRVREVCSATLGIREKENLRVRLPLSNLTVAAEDSENLTSFIELIKDELNVKEVTLSKDLSQFGTLELKVNPAIGKRVGGAMKEIMPASKQGNWTDNGDGTIEIAGHTLSAADNDYTMQLVTGEGTTAQQLSGQGAVILDTTVTPELENEGLARDLVRLIQQSRKDADLNVSDRIDLYLDVPEDMQAALTNYQDFVMSETLSQSLNYDSDPNCEHLSEQMLNNLSIRIGFSRTKAAAA